MPSRPKSICRKAGCSALVDKPGWCEKHTTLAVGWNQTSTKSANERGYGWAWKKKRDRIMKRDNGLCQCAECKAEGRIRIATEVDHIISKAKARAMGWTEAQIDDDSNLGAINIDCHKAKTARERTK
jgi:5-methylcytosine-specific restriction protein A